MAKGTLYIVPTAGNARDGEGNLIPAKNAIMRLHATVNNLLPDSTILLLGGVRRRTENGEAAVLHRWLHSTDSLAQQLLEIIRANRVEVIPLAIGKYTAEDMRRLARSGFLLNYDEIRVSSHSDQAWMAELTLRNERVAVPIYWINSGELAPYDATTLKILSWVYIHDPSWEHWQSAALRAKANLRGLGE